MDMADQPTDAPAAAPTRSVGFTANMEGLQAVQAKQMALIDQMILWQMANPGKPWTDCARVMEVSANWCRLVASSDAYKARYAAASDTAFREIGMFGISERLKVATEVALDRLADKLAVSESLGDITDATEVLLKGQFGGGAQAPSSQTHIHVHQDVIMQGRAALTAPPAPIDAEATEAPK
jgi:hypothetical protein